MDNKAVKKYIRKVNMTYRGNRNAKEQFLMELHDSLLCYCESHPDCSYQDLVEHFGSPQKLGGTLTSLLPPDLKKRNIFFSWLIILVAILVMIGIILFSYRYARESYQHSKGYYIEHTDKKIEPTATAVPSTSEPTPVVEYSFE